MNHLPPEEADKLITTYASVAYNTGINTIIIMTNVLKIGGCVSGVLTGIELISYNSSIYRAIGCGLGIAGAGYVGAWITFVVFKIKCFMYGVQATKDFLAPR